MAALQKVRNLSKLLVVILALALFAFIAEEAVRALSYTQAEKHQRIGSVLGESISITEFNQMVDEVTEITKMSYGLTNLTDDQAAQVRDQVWSTYVQDKILEEEANKLGLTVTDKELETIIQNGSNPILQSTMFVNKDGQYDYSMVERFLTQYEEVMSNPDYAEQRDGMISTMNYWNYVKKNIRRQVLSDKYQALLGNCIISNPVAAKFNYEGRTTQNEVLACALSYSSIEDAGEVSEKELKAKYEELKDLFFNPEETRNIKYIDVEVTASAADDEEMKKEMGEYASALAEAADPAKVVREANSLVAYSKVPVTTKSLPRDIAAQVDSMSVGELKGPYYFAGDNTYNIIRLIGRTQQYDSIQVRQIAVPGVDMADAAQRADSILAVLQTQSFDSVAASLKQPAQESWITSAMYEGQTLNDANVKFIETIQNIPAKTTQKIELENQGYIIVNVLDRRNLVTKYDVAVIKSVLDFSRDTYNAAFNKFSSFVAGKNSADIEAEAQKEGYNLQERQQLSNTERTVGGVRSTRDAMRWIFNEDTKIGDVSPLYECGDNDHMMVVVLTGINKKGNMPWDNEMVKSFLEGEVLKDKKAAKAQELMAVKSIQEAAAVKGVRTDTLHNVNFLQGTSGIIGEPVVGGAVSNMKQGDFKTGIRGNVAVYAIQVLSQQKGKEAYDQKQEEAMLRQQSMRAFSNFANDLYNKAVKNNDIVDNRYLFY